MWDLFKADLQRKRTYYVRIDNFVNKYLKITLQWGTLATAMYRLGGWTYQQCPTLLQGPMWFLYQILHAIVSTLTGVQINPRTPIGEGFVIHNFSSIFIDADSIGDNFTVNQDVSVGPDWKYQGRPKLGHNVYIGSGAKVLGNIEIGDGVVIASNSFVNRSVPDNCTVSGVPARIISRGSTSSYLNFTDKK